MADDTSKVKRVLQIKARALTADAASLMLSMLNSARPFYEAFGQPRVRLLRNVDDQAEFVQIIEYESDQAFELSRNKIASDPRFQMFKTMSGGAIDVSVYEDVSGGT